MKPTASSLQRALECAGSTVLPQCTDWSEAAERGVACHKYLERVIAGVPRDEALAEVPLEWRQWCADVDVPYILGDLTAIRVEIAYAVDPFAQTARVLEQDHERDYSRLTPTEFGGRGDLFGTMFGLPCYSDFKTGLDVGDLLHHAQSLFFATALHLETGADATLGRIIYILPDSSVRLATHRYTELDFSAMLNRLRRLHGQRERALEAIREGRWPDVRAGEWCRYCPGFLACPEKTAALRALPNKADELGHIGDLGALTPERAAQAWGVYSDIKEVFRRVEKQLKDYARMFTIPLPSGKVVRPVAKSKTSIRGERALGLLRSYGVPEDEIQSCVSLTEYDEIRETNRNE